MLICGIDDAGRGAVIGPLVIAGVLIQETDLPNLVSIGVKDSKLLTPAKRNSLAEEILKVTRKHHIVRLVPAEIDDVVETGAKLHRLNRLEAHAMAEVVKALRPQVAYVDASDVLPERFGQHIAEEVPFRVQIVSEHKADRTYPVVSAASVIAKVERDRLVAELRRKYGDLGSGYITDPRTVNFLEQWVRTQKPYPDFVRRSWKPAKKIRSDHNTSQKKLI